MSPRRPITFTLDLEDHRHPDAAVRYPALTRRLLERIEALGVRGTVFVVGDVARRSPELVRAAADAGHEIGLHGWDHVPLPELTPEVFRADVARGRALLEDLTGHPVIGFRAPVFSLVPASRWAVEVLQDAGFEYSSSVLPARSPVFGDPSRPARPFRWPGGLLELPCPVARVGSMGIPFLGGAYFRLLPSPVVRSLTAVSSRKQALWTYCHPYDFDPDEPFWVVPRLGRVGSRLLWYRRRGALAKLERLLRDRAALPLAERLEELADGAPLLTA